MLIPEAVHIYTLFQQEQDPELIATIIAAHLHDPIWDEPLLSLLEMLSRDSSYLTSLYINQILEGQSRRSAYSLWLGQDAFFAATCLLRPTIEVKMACAHNVVQHLCRLLVASPFPTQQEKILDLLTSLLASQYYSQSTQQILQTTFVQHTNIDPVVHLQILHLLLQCDSISANDKAAYALTFTDLLCSRDCPVERVLSFTTEKARRVYCPAEAPLVGRILRALLQRPTPPLGQIAQIASGYYQQAIANPEEHALATRLVLFLLSHPELPLIETLSLAWSLIKLSDKHSEEHIVAAHYLDARSQEPAIPTNTLLQPARILYSLQSLGDQDLQLVFNYLNTIRRRSELSPAQITNAACLLFTLKYYLPETGTMAIQALCALLHAPGLSSEQRADTALILYRMSSYDSAEVIIAEQHIRSVRRAAMNSINNFKTGCPISINYISPIHDRG